MTSEIIYNLYLTSLVLYVVVESILIVLNLRSAKKNNTQAETVLGVTQSQHEKLKSYNYTKDKSYLQILGLFISSISVILCIHFSVFGYTDQFLRSHIPNYYFRGCIYIFSFLALFAVIQLPLQLISTFIIEEKYGFNKMTISLWFKDLLKTLVLSVALMTPLISAILYFVEIFPETWWLIAFCVIFAFQLLLMIIFPSVIAPLFNKFERLQDEKLERKINKFATEVQFETFGIFQIDGSRRSSHGNAYFSGFGKGRRIVLFDTLINKLSHEEICAVLAHEIGHAKKHHILKSVVLSGVLLATCLYLASIFLLSPSFFTAFGMFEPSSYSLLVLISIAFEPITFFLSPLINSVSRRSEFEADEYAVTALQSTAALESALKTLSAESLSNLNPHSLYSFFHYSHPTLLERITAMRKAMPIT